LQGVGVVWIASGAAPAAIAAAVAPGWLGAWLAECCWQGIFQKLPLPADAANAATKARILLPAAAALLAAQASMLCAAWSLAAAVRSDPAAASSAAEVVAFATGLNAAWLCAASAIGVSLAAAQGSPALRRALASPQGGARLLGTAVAASAFLSVGAASQGAVGFAAGYTAATAWACFGMTRGDVSPEVKIIASRGIKAGGLTALAILALALLPTLAAETRA